MGVYAVTVEFSAATGDRGPKSSCQWGIHYRRSSRLAERRRNRRPCVAWRAVIDTTAAAGKLAEATGTLEGIGRIAAGTAGTRVFWDIEWRLVLR